jgi:CIC family chloride channel protein
MFIRGVYVAEDIFVKYFKNPYLRHAIGMFCVGIMLYVLMFFFGHYYIEGVGFATIEDVLNFVIKNPWLLLLILILKLLATFLTLGSGASGGIFSPSLFIGAILGAIWGIISNNFIISDINMISYIVAGMAGMLAGVTGGIITAIILCIEITKDYQHILPILITVAVAFITLSIFCHDSVYSLKLTRRNVDIHNKFKS